MTSGVGPAWQGTKKRVDRFESTCVPDIGDAVKKTGDNYQENPKQPVSCAGENCMRLC